MSQKRFVERGEPEWRRLETMLAALEQKGSAARAEDLPQLLRHASEDLALAQHRRYASSLVRRLNGLALRGHAMLYRARSWSWAGLLRYLGEDFPRAVRADGWLLVAGVVLLFGVGIAVGLAVQVWPELAYTIVGPEMLESLERMHDPKDTSRGHGAGGGVLAFGGYVEHNISIALWTYALGMLLGLGTLYLLLYNALVLGAVFGHMRVIGRGVALESFAVAHGAFELTGIMLAGVAGLKLGLAVLAPGRRTRSGALRDAARGGLPVVTGATAMLVLAAFLEAFWSADRSIEPRTKFVAGGACWLAVLAYLALAGRRRR